MGDTGAMLIGLLLAYGPISSTLSLDPAVLVNYPHGHTLNRFPTILPLLLPVAILVIPYADLLLAVIRRTAAGKSPFAPDRQHLHHRLLSMGHSHRQSVLLMYLWAALFSGAVVGLSVVRTQLVWLGVVTLAALVALLLATVPQLRPWHARESRAGTGQRVPATAPGYVASVIAVPAVSSASAAPAMPGWAVPDELDDGPNGAAASGAGTASTSADGTAETGEAAGPYGSEDAVPAHDAGDSAPHWSLGDFPAPPRYPRR
jgi:UDP-GlcNAc:undecaprenyl-phosphate GlcNAc-1-phosphate transferase